jgi:hypothetical protein
MRLINSRKPDGSSTAQGVVAVGGGYIGLWFLAVKRFLKKVHAALRSAADLWKTMDPGRRAAAADAQLAPLFIANSSSRFC